MSDTPEMPAEGGSYTRSPTTGRIKRVEEPTVQDVTSGSSDVAPVVEETPAEGDTNKNKGA